MPSPRSKDTTVAGRLRSATPDARKYGRRGLPVKAQIMVLGLGRVASCGAVDTGAGAGARLVPDARPAAARG